MIGSNPALKEDTFDLGYDIDTQTMPVMTLGSTVFKSMTLVGLCVVAATITWGMALVWRCRGPSAARSAGSSSR